MIELRPNILIISIDVNGLNSPIERKGLSDWLIKQNPTLCRIQDTPKTKRFKRVKNKRMEKDISGKHKKKTGHNPDIQQGETETKKL